MVTHRVFVPLNSIKTPPATEALLACSDPFGPYHQSDPGDEDPRAVSPSVPRLTEDETGVDDDYAWLCGAEWSKFQIRAMKDSMAATRCMFVGSSFRRVWINEAGDIQSEPIDASAVFTPMSGTTHPVALSTDTKTHGPLPTQAFQRWNDGR